MSYKKSIINEDELFNRFNSYSYRDIENIEEEIINLLTSAVNSEVCLDILKENSVVDYMASIIEYFTYILHYIFSFNIILGFKGTLLKLEKDSTEEITRKVKDKLLKGNYLNKRLIKAFPNLMETREHFKYRKEKIIEELKKYI